MTVTCLLISWQFVTYLVSQASKQFFSRMLVCHNSKQQPCHTLLIINRSRINCTHGVHRAPSAALALQGFLMEEKDCALVVIKHCTLNGWDGGQANLIEEWLETEPHRRTSVRAQGICLIELHLVWTHSKVSLFAGLCHDYGWHASCQVVCVCVCVFVCVCVCE